jgi:hypothetical protein
MKTLRLALIALACSAPLVASAQWIWQGSDGRKVFSDRPPPSDVPSNRILKQPGQRGVGAAGAAAGTATMDNGNAATDSGATETAAAPAVPALRVTGKDKELEEKRKQITAAEAEKKKAEEQKLAQARADNCKRARSSKATFDSGLRVARTNEKGEREFLDDKQREAEGKRVEAVIARDCETAQAQ